jgi:hypothetical protein
VDFYEATLSRSLSSRRRHFLQVHLRHLPKPFIRFLAHFLQSRSLPRARFLHFLHRIYAPQGKDGNTLFHPQRYLQGGWVSMGEGVGEWGVPTSLVA